MRNFFSQSLSVVLSGLTVLLCLFSSTIAEAQSTNDWIDHTKTHYKFMVEDDGLYRVTKSLLEENGLPTNGDDLRIYHEGEAITFYSTASGDMGEDDFLEFYAAGNSGAFDTQLYASPSHQPNVFESLFTDTAAYFIVATPGVGGPYYEDAANELSDTPDPETFFMHQGYRDLTQTFSAGQPANVSGKKVYLADYGIGEGFASNTIDEDSEEEYSVNTQSVYLGSDAPALATLSSKLIGRSNDAFVYEDHHVDVSVSGVLQEDYLFEGYKMIDISFAVATSLLEDGNTDVSFASLTDMSAVNKFKVPYVTIDYPHSFDFDNDRNYYFELNNDEDKYIEITNFNGGSAPILYDLSNNLRFVPEVESGTYKIFLPQVVGGAAKRRLYICNTTQTAAPFYALRYVENLTPVDFINYAGSSAQGDYIIITHKKLRQGDVDQVARYADYRASEAGGGFNVVTVDIDQLYDQYAYGIKKHPYAIRNFINYSAVHWSEAPEYLLILGKGLGYDATNTNFRFNEVCLVPTYGNSPSDVNLAAQNDSLYYPQLAVGRIPAYNSNEVRMYLDKVIDYEALDDVLACTPEDRLWTKDGLHIAGGFSFSEAEDFMEYLEKYKAIYEDSLLAGRIVATYNSLSEDVIDYEAGIDDVIEAGISIMTFFGHGYGENLQVNIKEPEEYNNYGKYPFFMAASCLVGDIHDYSTQSSTGEIIPSLSENFVLADSVGAIGFLATSTFGTPTFLDRYLEKAYTNFSKDTYELPIGKALQKTIYDLYIDNPESAAQKEHAQTFTLNADPAIRIGIWEKPEFYVDESSVTITPLTITSDLDEFAVNVVVRNLGRATSDSITVNIARTLPDGTVLATAASARFPAPVYADTLTVMVPTGDEDLVTGENSLFIEIDYGQEIEEDCEDNNSISRNMFVLSDLLIPIAPCDHAIVNDPDLTLYASTGKPILPVLPYVFELDTTENFDSGIKEVYTTSAPGGVVTWTPTLDLLPNTTYYWRSSSVPDDGSSYRWKVQSFTYLPTSSDLGWHQQHYYQYIKDDYNNILLDSIARDFEFKINENIISVTNDYDNPENAAVLLNGGVLNEGTCLYDAFGQDCKGGLVFSVLKPGPNLEPLKSEYISGLSCDSKGTYGNIHCGSFDKYVFEFYTGPNFWESTGQLDSLSNFLLNVVETGDYVVVYSSHDDHLAWMQSTATTFYNVIEVFLGSIGLTAEQISGLNDELPFIAFGQRYGDYSLTQLIKGADQSAPINFSIDLSTNTGVGSISSIPVGPAMSWDNLNWNFDQVDEAMVDLEVWGLNTPADPEADLLLTTEGGEGNLDLSSIDAEQYPFVRLKALVVDTLNYAMPQLQSWTVSFDRYREVALNAGALLSLTEDTLQEGENLELQLALVNAEQTSIDSLVVGYTVIDEENVQHPISYPAYPSMTSGEAAEISFDWNTVGFGGEHLLRVELNPESSGIGEKYSFNNVITLPFYIESDQINPYVEVTFDGEHILDGELVSASPEIVVQITDENPYLALNDTADYELFLTYPDENGIATDEQSIAFDDPIIQFIPASDTDALEGNNQARIQLNPSFTQNGQYELSVRAKDRSDNSFAKAEFNVSFEVITESTITNVINYPNPFSSATRFVFTLTGSEVPEYMKIQIMTVNGTVVREIDQSELGPIHIGENITDFAWDGTDQYGDQLANGVYLYRVITRLNGESIEHNANASDAYFHKKGIGKMYLMR